jgi:PIN domain nuclease of toxin-antitoxin system
MKSEPCTRCLDRMLVAQAQAEGLDIVTGEGMIGKCGVKTIDAWL